MMVLAILLVAVVAAVYLIVVRYVRMATRSVASANRLWSDIDRAVRAFVESGQSPSAAQIVIQLAAAAGCGCFVRGILLSHYLPRVVLSSRGENQSKAQFAFDALNRLPADEQNAFSQILVMVIVYDSFQNPLQGLLFRHTIESFTKPQISWSDQLEAKLAAFSIISRRRVFAR